MQMGVRLYSNTHHPVCAHTATLLFKHVLEYILAQPTRPGPQVLKNSILNSSEHISNP